MAYNYFITRIDTIKRPCIDKLTSASLEVETAGALGGDESQTDYSLAIPEGLEIYEVQPDGSLVSLGGDTIKMRVLGDLENESLAKVLREAADFVSTRF